MTLSVLMPVYNAAATLGESMGTLLSQTLADFEVVAVDDGSTDGSGGMLDAFAARDARVRVIHLPRSGVVVALNAGLAACRGAFIARMDADDLSHPERLEAQLALLRARPDVGVVGCLVEGMGTDGAPLQAGMVRYLEWLNRLIEPDEIARERFIESPIVHPSALVRRELFARVGGYRDRGWPQDYDLWMRLVRGGARMAKVPRVLFWWRDHPARVTRTQPNNAAERIRALKVHHLLRGPLSEGRPVVFWGAGTEGKPLLRALGAAGVPLPLVLEAHPRRIGQVIHGAKVLARSHLPRVLAESPGALVLVAVGVPAARPVIRAQLEALGQREGESFYFLC